MTAPVPTFDVELSPMSRQTSVAYVHDVELDADQHLEVGDQVKLRDEGGQPWDGVVTEIVDVRLGHTYALRIRRRDSTA